MKKIIFSLMLIMSFVPTVFCQNNTIDKDNLRDRVQSDPIFKKLIETKRTQLSYTKNGFFGVDNVTKKLKLEQLRAATTPEAKIKLYESVGMKNAETYMRLNDDFRRCMEQIKVKYPEIKQLSRDEFQGIFNELIVLSVASNSAKKANFKH